MNILRILGAVALGVLALASASVFMALPDGTHSLLDLPLLATFALSWCAAHLLLTRRAT